jgi:hypothetical protein
MSPLFGVGSAGAAGTGAGVAPADGGGCFVGAAVAGAGLGSFVGSAEAEAAKTAETTPAAMAQPAANLRLVNTARRNARLTCGPLLYCCRAPAKLPTHRCRGEIVTITVDLVDAVVCGFSRW